MNYRLTKKSPTIRKMLSSVTLSYRNSDFSKVRPTLLVSLWEPVRNVTLLFVFVVLDELNPGPLHTRQGISHELHA